MHTWGRHVLYFCSSAVSCSKMAVLVSHHVVHKFTGVLDYTSFKKDLTWRLKIGHRKRTPPMFQGGYHVPFWEYFNSMFYLVHSDESSCSLWSNLFVCQGLLWSVCAFGGILHLSEIWCSIGWHFSYKQQSKVLSHQKPLQQSTPTIIISISQTYCETNLPGENMTLNICQMNDSGGKRTWYFNGNAPSKHLNWQIKVVVLWRK